MQRVLWPTPPDWVYVAREDPIELFFVNMSLPNNQGEWPEELGGRIYPPGKRCKLSQQFLDQLKEDCPDCPAMPDHENGADAKAAAAIPSESYLFLPQWMITSWVSTVG